MTISFPVSAPSTPKPTTVKWIQSNIVGYSLSPYTLQQQTYEYGGEGWAVEVSIDPLPRSEAAPWFAFLSSLRGRLGTFYFGDTLLSSPQGAGGGTPKVNGGSQAGSKVLVSDGFPNGTIVLKAGDMIQINTSLYLVLADCTSDGSGNASIDVWPRLRTHADNSDIVLSNPKGVFRLSENTPVIIEARADQYFNITFMAEEAI
jgi:hypothetical protein